MNHNVGVRNQTSFSEREALLTAEAISPAPQKLFFSAPPYINKYISLVQTLAHKLNSYSIFLVTLYFF